jgi:hypothetical protein
MANVIKIGSTYLNLDRVRRVDDLFPRSADDLRTWLNSIATNLKAPRDLDAAG